jgi:hypothetical protein
MPNLHPSLFGTGAKLKCKVSSDLKHRELNSMNNCIFLFSLAGADANQIITEVPDGGHSKRFNVKSRITLHVSVHE